METIEIVKNPGAWLQGGALGVLFAAILVAAFVIMPLIGVIVWAVRTLVNSLTGSVDRRLAGIARLLTDTRDMLAAVAAKLDTALSQRPAAHQDRDASSAAADATQPLPHTTTEKGTTP